jgi:hypothetical protein
MTHDYSELLKTHDDCKADASTTVIEDEMATAIRALVAENERLALALKDLLRTSAVVQRKGAVTGFQWTGLGMSILKARAALGETK